MKNLKMNMKKRGLDLKICATSATHYRCRILNYLIYISSLKMFLKKYD